MGKPGWWWAKQRKIKKARKAVKVSYEDVKEEVVATQEERYEEDLVAEYLKKEDEILAKYKVDEAFAFDRLMAELEELLEF